LLMKLFDAHCHLQDEALFPHLGNVMARAAAAGVERLACCGASSRDWKRVARLAEEYPQIVPMFGIHPWFVSKDWKNDFQTLEKTVRDFPLSGIGETGLDFQVRFTNRAEQEASFAAHLDLARELNRPIAVHCVQAWGRLIGILREHPAPRVVLHAFGGAPELIPELIDLNCWFSFCGAVTNPKAKRVRASAQAVPDGRLLIETDSPDFPPAGCEPPNEPAHLVLIARAVAELRGVSVERLAGITFLNESKVFDAI
jgi:TatD DNase family protein